jgi:hypothetical protein
LRRRKDLALAGAPFFGRNFPDFGGEAAGNVVAVFGGDQAHALFFGDAAGGDVGDGFGSAENGEVKYIKPKIGNGFAGFGHQALALPGETEPEAAIVVFFFTEVDAADDLAGIGFQAKSPVPGFTAIDGREGDVANIAVGPIRGIGPGNLRGEVPDDFPMGKESLNLCSVGEF